MHQFFDNVVEREVYRNGVKGYKESDTSSSICLVNNKLLLVKLKYISRVMYKGKHESKSIWSCFCT